MSNYIINQGVAGGVVGAAQVIQPSNEEIASNQQDMRVSQQSLGMNLGSKVKSILLSSVQEESKDNYSNSIVFSKESISQSMIE